MKKKTLLIGLMVFIFIGIIFATTWFDAIVKCPICKTKNTFKQIGSYGGYIYNWPEKFEYIFWPVTETYSMYSCRQCKYTAFMWDFEDINGDTLQLIKNAIDTLQIDMKANKDYTKIPMHKKLETAEIFYKLYMTDNNFWCRFYRIKGYHYGFDRMKKKAEESRLTALSIAEKMLIDSVNDYRKKELYLIIGAMKHFTGQDSLALLDFEKAKKLEYLNPKNDSFKNADMNQYLDALFVEYEDLIKNLSE